MSTREIAVAQHWGAAWHDGSGPIEGSWNPADGTLVSTYASASLDDVRAAVAAAWHVYPEWRATPIEERARLLERVAVNLSDHGPLLSALTDELGVDATFAAAELRRGVGAMRAVLAREGVRAEQFRPLGMVGIVTDSSSPACVPVWKLTSALLYGNAVAWVPSASAPVCAALIAEAFAEVLPGALSILLGRDAAGHLCTQELDGVALVGRDEELVPLRATTHERGTLTDVDLVGAGVAVVFDDADVAAAADAIAADAFRVSGQCSAATKVVVVDRGVATEFTQALATRTLTARTAPVVDVQHAYRAFAAISAAAEDGRTVTTNSASPTAAGDRFVDPAIIELRDQGQALRALSAPVIGVAVAQTAEEMVHLVGDALVAYCFGGAAEDRVTPSLDALVLASKPCAHPVIYRGTGVPRRAVTPDDAAPRLVVEVHNQPSERKRT